MSKPRTYKSAKVRLAVIEHFRQCGRVDLACQLAGVDRRQHYRWLASDEEYVRLFDAALPEAAGLLADEVMRRGVEGVREPVFSGGKQATMYKLDSKGDPITGTDGKLIEIPAFVRRYSDACLLAAAGARVPGFGQKLNHRLVDADGKDRQREDKDLNIVVEYINKPIPE